MRDVTKVLSNRLCRYKSTPNITTELGLKICQISQREVPDLNEKSGTSCFVLVMMVFICAPSYRKVILSEIEGEVDVQTLIARLDTDVAWLTVWSLLLNRLI